MIGDVIMHGTYVTCEKKTREKDVVGTVIFNLTVLLPINHVIAYSTMAHRRF